MATGKRHHLADSERARLRSQLQLATLAALMNARRWEPGDIAFQGGTSLHLAHGSARFSEDLDFMVRRGVSLMGLAKEVKAKLRLPAEVTADLEVSVTSAKDARNPHMFYVTLAGSKVLGSVKVKVELWQTQARALTAVEAKVSTVGGGYGAQAFVPTLTLQEILADKVYALGARNRLKPRDVFDVWWLAQRGVKQIAMEALRTRLDIYPIGGDETHSQTQSHTARAWMDNAALRMAALRHANAAVLIEDDLRRWLPAVWDMRTSPVSDMIAAAIQALESGMDHLESCAAQYTGAHKVVEQATSADELPSRDERVRVRDQ